MIKNIFDKISKNKYLILTILFIFFSFFIYGLNSFHDNIWYDEAYQMVLNRYSLVEIIDFVRRDTSGPLYAILLKMVTSIFGTELYVGRMLSLAIFSIQFIIAFYPIRRLYNGKTSIILSCILLASKISFFASIEIRLYSLAITSTLGAVTYSLLYLKENKKSDLIKYIIFALCALYSHNFSMVSICSMILISSIYSLYTKKSKSILKANMLLVVLYIPWFIILLQQYNDVVNKNLFPKPTFLAIKDAITKLLTNNIYVNIAIAVILVTSILISIKKKKELKSITYLLIPSLGCLTFLYIWSLLKTPLFLSKYIAPLSSILYLIIAKIVGNNKNKILPIILVALFIPTFITTYEKERSLTSDYEIERLVQFVKNHQKGKIAFYHIYEFGFGMSEYYFPNSKHYLSEYIEMNLKTPELFGEVIKVTEETKMKEEIIISLSPRNLGMDFYYQLMQKGYYPMIDYQEYIPYNGGFQIYIFKKKAQLLNN